MTVPRNNQVEGVIKVSVIIPIYNAEPYLHQCMQSLCEQTLQEIEIICINDGSTDQSLEILNQRAKEDSRIQIITQDNSGASVARNRGLQVAQGQYLSILDADDFYELDMLEMAYLRAIQQDADIVVFGSDHYIDKTGNYEAIPWTMNATLLPDALCFSALDVKKDVFRSIVGWSWDKLFRREFIEREALRFQEISLHNDLVFVYGAFALADRITMIESIFVHHRKHDKSLSVGRIAWHCTYQAMVGLKQLLIEKQIYTRYEQDYVNYVLHLFNHLLTRLCAQDYVEAYQEMGETWIPALELLEHEPEYYYNLKEYERAVRVVKEAKGELVEQYSMAKGGLSCLKEHGAAYTFHRVKLKLYKKLQWTNKKNSKQ